MGKSKKNNACQRKGFFLDIHSTQKAYKKKYRFGVLWKWWNVVMQEGEGVWTCHVYCKEFLTPPTLTEKISAFMKQLLHLADFFSYGDT
jgi:hypothetical protein